MYNVLIVEDELMVRIGIKNSIKWADFNMNVIAEATNGKEGYQYFQEYRPEIIITDIRMNCMNGTEMIKKVRETDTDCFIIVISCMEDFDLLQDIVNCQIFCYLLKATMKISDLEEMLLQIRKKLDSGKRSTLKSSSAKEININAVFSRWLKEDPPTSYSQLVRQYPILFSHPQTLFMYRVNRHQDSILSDLHARFITDILSRMLPRSITFCPENSVFIQLSELSVANPEHTAGEITTTVRNYLNIEIQCRYKCSDHLADFLKDEISRYLLESMPCEKHIDRALAYIRRNYCKDISLSDVAACCGISPNYFSLLFKQQTGESFTKYLNRLRIEKARLLLDQTEMYIYEISDSLGYNDLTYFSRIFKQQTGLSPSDWRLIRHTSKTD